MFQKQIMMRRVLYSLIPIFIFSIYLYGWRVPALAFEVFLIGILTEYLIERTRKKKVSEAVLVTCALYTLSLPPAVPFWIAAIGIIFAVLFAKGVYGGFGRNIFNPAIAGRLFVYISFPSYMTQGWMIPGKFGTIDTVTKATSLEIIKDGKSIDIFSHLLGIRSGSIGESAAILIMLGALYLVITKTANWRLIASTVLSSAITILIINFFSHNISLGLIPSFLSGSILFVSVFIATDPISAPKKNISMWFYGGIIGSVSIIVRTFSLFPEGTSFGILLGNCFASFLDDLFTKKAGVNK